MITATATAIDEGEPEQGWAWPEDSRKAHYFRAKRALCGKWAWWGPLHDSGYHDSDTCKECKKRLEAK